MYGLSILRILDHWAALGIKLRIMKQPEYKEGPQIREEFERTMTALFRAPKPVERKKAEKKTTARKTKKADKD